MSARARGAIVLMYVAAALWTASAAAGQPIRTEPPEGSAQRRVPPRVTITFQHEQARTSTIEVVDPCGARADRGDASVAGRQVSIGIRGTASGRYEVAYAGISAADGSAQRGTFTFRVLGVEGCAAGDRPDARAGRGIWDLPKTDFAVALAIAALIGALGGLVYAAILGPKA
jgi:methionine-rich copper-binding protein CopC